MENNEEKKENSFSVCTYAIHDLNGSHYCHWAKNLSMVIQKNGVTMELNSEEIQQLVGALPQTFGGRY